MLNIPIKEAPKSGQKKEYPVLQDPQCQLAFQVDDLVQLRQEIETLTARCKNLEHNIKGEAVQQFFRQHRGKSDPPSSMLVEGLDSKCLVTFTNRYPQIPVKEAEDIEYLENAGVPLQEKVIVKMDFDKVPTDCQQDFITEVAELAAKYGASDALSAKQTKVVKSSWHQDRHKALAPRENSKLQERYPMTVTLKTKGVV